MWRQAASLDEAICQLEELDAPLLFHCGNFTLPFLQHASLRCGREFSCPCLLLDRLAAQLLGCSPRQKADKFLEKLPPPVGGNIPPQDRYLKKIYELSLAVFQVLEKTNHIEHTAQLTDFYHRRNLYEYIGYPDL